MHTEPYLYSQPQQFYPFMNQASSSLPSLGYQSPLYQQYTPHNSPAPFHQYHQFNEIYSPFLNQHPYRKKHLLLSTPTYLPRTQQQFPSPRPKILKIKYLP